MRVSVKYQLEINSTLKAEVFRDLNKETVNIWTRVWKPQKIGQLLRTGAS